MKPYRQARPRSAVLAGAIAEVAIFVLALGVLGALLFLGDAAVRSG